MVLDLDVHKSDEVHQHVMDMLADLGPLPFTVRTGRGGWHVYLKHVDGLPAKIFWKGTVVGELQAASVSAYRGGDAR